MHLFLINLNTVPAKNEIKANAHDNDTFERFAMLEVFTRIVKVAANLVRVGSICREIEPLSTAIRLHSRSCMTTTRGGTNSVDNSNIKETLSNEFLYEAKPWMEAGLS